MALCIALPSVAQDVKSSDLGTEAAIAVQLNDKLSRDEALDRLLELSLEDLYQIEVITVTARKRTESVQRIPVSVTAIDRSTGTRTERNHGH